MCICIYIYICRERYRKRERYREIYRQIDARTYMLIYAYVRRRPSHKGRRLGGVRTKQADRPQPMRQ